MLRLTLENPSAGAGTLELAADGRSLFQRTGMGPRREARLSVDEVVALERILREGRVCALPSDSTRAFANYLVVEPAWPGLACRVRRTETAWTEAAESVREALRGLERRTCGGTCPLDVAR